MAPASGWRLEREELCEGESGYGMEDQKTQTPEADVGGGEKKKELEGKEEGPPPQSASPSGGTSEVGGTKPGEGEGGGGSKVSDDGRGKDTSAAPEAAFSPQSGAAASADVTAAKASPLPGNTAAGRHVGSASSRPVKEGGVSKDAVPASEPSKPSAAPSPKEGDVPSNAATKEGAVPQDAAASKQGAAPDPTSVGEASKPKEGAANTAGKEASGKDASSKEGASSNDASKPMGDAVKESEPKEAMAADGGGDKPAEVIQPAKQGGDGKDLTRRDDGSSGVAKADDSAGKSSETASSTPFTTG